MYRKKRSALFVFLSDFPHAEPVIPVTGIPRLPHPLLQLLRIPKPVRPHAAETQAALKLQELLIRLPSPFVPSARTHAAGQPRGGPVVARIFKSPRFRMVGKLRNAGCPGVRQKTDVLRAVRDMQLIKGGPLSFPFPQNTSQPLNPLPLHGGARKNDSDGSVRHVQPFIQRPAGDQNADFPV